MGSMFLEAHVYVYGESQDNAKVFIILYEH